MKNTLYNNSQLGLNEGDIERYSKVNGLSLQNLFYVEYSKFPNCYMFSESESDKEKFFDTLSMMKEIEKKFGKNDNIMSVHYIIYDYETQKEKHGFNIILKNEKIFARFENSPEESYILYLNESVKNLKKILNIVHKYYVLPEIKSNRVSKISTLPNGGYCLTDYPVESVENFDINKQYNDDFLPQANKIEKFMKKDKSGLIILHGKKGTGKTTYIRHLIDIFPEKRFIFLSSTMADFFNDPSADKFLHSIHDTVIILEDCEGMIKSRKSTNSSPAVASLLNMTDGLLSDGLKLKFICTFNESIDSIDDALLRKGRLVSKYNFSELSVDKTKALFKELYGKDLGQDIKLSLADIYNFEDESYEEKKKTII